MMTTQRPTMPCILRIMVLAKGPMVSCRVLLSLLNTPITVLVMDRPKCYGYVNGL